MALIESWSKMFLALDKKWTYNQIKRRLFSKRKQRSDPWKINITTHHRIMLGF
jgi:hypothetical protein